MTKPEMHRALVLIDENMDGEPTAYSCNPYGEPLLQPQADMTNVRPGEVSFDEFCNWWVTLTGEAGGGADDKVSQHAASR